MLRRGVAFTLLFSALLCSGLIFPGPLVLAAGSLRREMEEGWEKEVWKQRSLHSGGRFSMVVLGQYSGLVCMGWTALDWMDGYAGDQGVRSL